MNELIEYIRRELSEEELLAQLAEEAVELAHAALKLRRARSNENPTPVTTHKALQAIEEEIADVRLLLNVLDLPCNNLVYIQRAKIARWVARLQNREE